MLRYSLRELLRNPRRTLASVAGVTLGVGLLASISFFVDTSASTMTKRAIARVPIDMAAGLASPLAPTITLKEGLPPGAMAGGQAATVTLTATNNGNRPATGVVIKDEPPPPLVYVPGSTAIDGRPLPDPEEQAAPVAGVAIANLPPKASVTVIYQARASAPVPLTQALALHGTVASAEEPTPSAVNAPRPVPLEELQAEAARLRGIRSADRLAIVDLPPGALRASGPALGGPLRLFAFDRNYAAHYPSVSLTDGSLTPGAAVLSVEAARALAVGRGTSIILSVPGRSSPISLPISGIADLSHAESLFASRSGESTGDFIYVPNSVVIPPEMFEEVIRPALRADAVAATPAVTTPPVLEVDVQIDRSQLSTDPASALIRTQGLRRSIERIAPGQVQVLDNLSTTLTVARSDAVVAKILFLFLGLPGVLLAAFLSGYAGSLLVQAQRREHAILRTRGAGPGHLTRLLAYNTLEVASLGSLLGLGLGTCTVILVLGRATLSEAAPPDLLTSALLAVAAGLLATAIAIYLPGRRALGREVSEERREMSVSAQPAWSRFRLDLVLLAAAAVVELVLYLSGGFTPTPVEGQSVSLSFYLLLAPLMVWLGGTLLMARMFLLAAPRMPTPRGGRFGSIIIGALRRSLKRRPGALASGMVGVALAVALGTNVAIVVATYDAEKAADARFVVGSDLRVTPSALSPQPASFASKLQVSGVTGATPVVFHVANSVVGNDRKDLAAVDPSSLQRTAELPDGFFLDGSASDAMSALRAEPGALLVEWELARDFNIQTGDPLKVQLSDVAGRDISANFRVAGRFRQFPGFPQHVDLVINQSYYQAVTGRPTVDFFLLRTADPSDAGLTQSTRALLSGPGSTVPLRVESIVTAVNRDQSTLAALNLRGLGTLDILYTLLLGAAGIGIFVFGLLLQRRKEYVTLRALGMRMRELQGLIVGEAALVAICGLLVGVLVGTVMAYLFVQILRPLFTLPPDRLTFPPGQMATLVALVLAGMVASALAASGILRRLRPAELLREE
jgi:putative ABC transport system permease protein